MNRIDLQPILENQDLLIKPLQSSDFETLYMVASDPLIWEQHPSKDRWKRDVFELFFQGAMESGGAFKIVNKKTNEIMGTTRFYDYKADVSSIQIGYTFYAIEHWGRGINLAVKNLLLDYIFQFVTQVKFQIGASNIRSQIAISRLGANKLEEREVIYYGEAKPNLNFIFAIDRKDWVKHKSDE
jgi:RimJ/RimL family protein N-acetyltransferase